MSAIKLSPGATEYADRFRHVIDTGTMLPVQIRELVATAFECGRLSGFGDAAKVLVEMANQNVDEARNREQRHE